MSPSVTSADLPALYQRADSFSDRAQTHHFAALGLYLVLLLGGSALSSHFWNAEYDLIVLLTFTFALAVLIYLQYWSPEANWYNGRAVAESIKTRTWRWMMCAPPYGPSSELHSVSSLFIGDLHSILQENRVRRIPATRGPRESPITDKMKLVRRLPPKERLQVYLQDRVADQQTFYEQRADFNRKSADRWFWFSALLHGGVILLLTINVRQDFSAIDVSPFATAAAVVATWTQSKKHRELAEAYSLAAHEIGLIYGYADSVTDEATLEDFVINSESAFSREHTQWAARRST